MERGTSGVMGTTAIVARFEVMCFFVSFEPSTSKTRELCTNSVLNVLACMKLIKVGELQKLRNVYSVECEVQCRYVCAY